MRQMGCICDCPLNPFGLGDSIVNAKKKIGNPPFDSDDSDESDGASPTINQKEKYISKDLFSRFDGAQVTWADVKYTWGTPLNAGPYLHPAQPDGSEGWEETRPDPKGAKPAKGARGGGRASWGNRTRQSVVQSG
ncbi:hypothetical protein NDU88_008784 [Pleurodeles waltl]|uniref:Uncharacterized protein n=1 Tax=Pleurodeles waltl TaxID=8319 RepID=A0AAV7RTE2_PLEWA|nr:hypothetical protein NDU88_008784 [Pleurodeles waltl]